jgi:acetolactate synthase I/II/III large subunit
MFAIPFTDSPIPATEAIVRVLEECGIDLTFGMSGGHTGRILGALARHTSTIRTVLVRHEALAVAGAESYARVTGRPGVAIGQGSWLMGHGVVGALEGLLGGTPMILIGDLSDGSPYSLHAPYQSATGEYGTWNGRQAFSGITKLVMEPRDPVQAVQCTQLAIKHAMAGQPGPVALLFHSASLTGQVGPQSIPRLYSTQGYLTKPVACTPDMTSIAAALRTADRPILIAGGGVRAGRAENVLSELAIASETPVVTTTAGKGTFPENHRLAAGVFGNFGSPFANEVLRNADVVIIVGSKLGPSDTANESPRLLDPTRQRFIQIDVEPRNAAWTFPADTVVIGDAGVALETLLRELRSNPVDQGQLVRRRSSFGDLRRQAPVLREASSEGIPMHPQRVITDLRNALPDDAIVCADAGENRLLMCRYFEHRERGIYLQPAAAGGMGYAIPAALAAKLVHPGRTVVAVCGDGGVGVSLPGLLTAFEEKIPILVAVFNNGALGWVKHGQRERGEIEFNSTLYDFDYAHIAGSMGWESYRVHKPDELVAVLKEATASGRPSLVDIPVSTEETFVDLRTPLLSDAALAHE